ncbi:unnamed protein product [Zymoseptoria tritici ST99CH_1A5]|uniref:Rab-GAP TBC domain-containing protein n=3 Tax=Zymoseptoria tritici TaxID=1047171 RepID=A0A1X7RUK1_ZYMT9|nr:unnamed protein product [Zymoseptoria tritici ST99CH_3D7]SMR53042.1 unnamed protein product [Zymoseptoria tritici ST99CH_1E4]SMR54593.1 unnamed protein product [Zymoseptoria tritici ST99CH_3D1]SMY24781.1 unnamed protein product [Zymoseptoria tritici ST99CH_1A5]
MTALESILHKGPAAGDHNAGLEDLRRAILLDGIPSNSEGMSELRIYTWLILLNAPPLPHTSYADLVAQGASPVYAKIRADTHRTLTTDPLFRRRVTENSLTRVLNAVAWKLQDAHEAHVNGWTSPRGPLGVPRSIAGDAPEFASPGRGSVTDGSEAGEGLGARETPAHIGYVQGMNVLAAPFLYASHSETAAYTAFSTLITTQVPGYITSNMAGVHRGCALVDQILAVVDPKLAAHLSSKGMTAEIYAFASVLTCCACTPPLPEVLVLWDFLLAYGVHLNVLAVVAQVVLMRDGLMGSSTPKPDFKPLRARKVIDYTVNFARKVPRDLYEQMLVHAK